MTEEFKLDLMKKFKELNVAEYTTKYGDYYGLMFAGADIVTKELQEENLKLEAKVRTLEIEQNYCLPNCSKIANLEAQIEKMKLCQNCKFEDNDYLAKPCCDCTRCFGDIKRNGNSDKWEIKEK